MKCQNEVRTRFPGPRLLTPKFPKCDSGLLWLLPLGCVNSFQVVTCTGNCGSGQMRWKGENRPVSWFLCFPGTSQPLDPSLCSWCALDTGWEVKEESRNKDALVEPGLLVRIPDTRERWAAWFPRQPAHPDPCSCSPCGPLRWGLWVPYWALGSQ